MRVRSARRALTALLTLCLLLPAQASVVIQTTRVIYPAQAREVAVALVNKADHPALVQAWVDDGTVDARPENSRAPFVLLPPVFRLAPQQGQSLRISQQGLSALPSDRESLFWLNVLDIPPKPAAGTQNYLQMAIRSRIKLFYRPASLPGNAQQAAGQLQARQQGHTLTLYNPSPYHITLSQLEGENARQQRTPLAVEMLAPFASLQHTLPDSQPLRQVHYRTIDDYGAQVAHQRPVGH